MAVHLVLALLILSMAGHSSASYCVCKQGISSGILQKAIDYACGAGADCNPISPSGQCYNPNSIGNHCSYAVNSYYQKNAAKGATCDFSGAAMLTNSNPSSGGCSFSASSGSSSTGTTSPVTTVPTTSPTTPTSTPITPVSGTGVTPVSGTGGTGGTGGMGGTGTGTNPTTTSPYTASPNAGNGVLGGVGTGLPPTGSSYDDSDGGIKLQSTTLSSIFATLAMSTVMVMWN
ncbi:PLASMODESMATA CALLOSE-BINDING PROTEIN 3 [Beta vulgaris subsp. vulgaris]|uniref:PLASMODESMATA CALLOSE-BINDING PROTEIN 3 n=1 Tax=Beta vulgaris subsp. vulgaris TaxID=3555 RepID=UPI0020366BC2|nr:PLASMODESMATA CALLOSE-BINDING PROTEIN 3 [Beta vulgaris subsp. vulgaris]